MSCQATICAVLLLGAALPCAADASAGRAPAGYHDVTVGSGDHKSVIRVRDSAKPHFHGGSSSDSDADGPYSPQNMNLGKSSPMSDKSFDTGFAALSKNDTAAEGRNSQSFVTHPFSTTVYNQSGSKYQTMAYDQSSRSSENFSKAYALPAANAGATRTFTIKSSEYQGKTALVAQTPSKADPFATPSSLSEKTFFDPAMEHVHRDPYASGLDVKRLTDLPNRTMTIDEVRNLINHEQIPDLNAKSELPSKALNDPGWEPPTVAPLAHDNMPTPPPAEMEKEGDLPSPGEMAQPPENSEPLPK